MSQISNDRNRFQENLREHHGGSHVQINTASVQTRNYRTEQAKVVMGRFAQSLTGCGWMRMNIVRPDRHMHRNRYGFVVGACQNAGVPMSEGSGRVLCTDKSP